MNDITKKFKEQYNKKKKEIKKIIDLDKNYKHKYSENMMRLIYNDRIIIEGEYKTVGVYDKSTSIWYWAWFLNFISKNDYNKTPIKNFCKKIKNDKVIDSFEREKYHFYTSRDYLYADNDNVKEIIAMILNIYNGEWIFEIPIKNNNDDSKVKYIVLTSIKKI